jgi:hypothetical protein
MSKLLEQIIRQVLNEGQIKISIETVKPEDEQIIKDVQNRLKIDSTKRKFETLDGLRVVLQRIGGRAEQPSGEKTFAIDPTELQSQVLMKLNSLTGLYKPMTGPDYIWLITTDLRLNDKRDERKPKEERIFARYSVTAIYIQKSLIAKQVTSSITGYLDTLRNGAMVFAYDKFNAAQWTNRGNDASKQATSDLVNAPFGTVSFGDNDPLVKSLNVYFNLAKEFGFNLTNDFNCDLKGAIQQFQIENKLEATGNYDAKTSNKARSLQNPIYVFKDKEAVKRLAMQCSVEQTSGTVVGDIKIPEGGFKYSGPMADPTKGTAKDPEFYKVQQLMASALVTLGFTTNKKHKQEAQSFIDGIKNNQGDYADRTRLHVGKLKNVMIKQNIDLKNTSNEVVDQQFVEILTKIK